MDLTLFTMTEEKNKVVKTPTNPVYFTGGVLKVQSSLINPVITLQTATFGSSNYAYIPDFSRYYFIRNITAMRNGFFEIEMSVDVLMSFHASILSLKCVIGRQENLYNIYLDDPNFKTYNYQNITTKSFPSGFNEGHSFILTVAGG